MNQWPSHACECPRVSAAVAVRAAARAAAARAAGARAWRASLAGPTRSLDAVCTAALHDRSDAALDTTATLFLQLAAQERALAPPPQGAAGDGPCTERLPAASASGLHDTA